MSEYSRISIPNNTNIDIYRIADEELCIILDETTGGYIRFGSQRHAIGKLEDALKILEKRPDPGFIIVKLSCISFS